MSVEPDKHETDSEMVIGHWNLRAKERKANLIWTKQNEWRRRNKEKTSCRDIDRQRNPNRGSAARVWPMMFETKVWIVPAVVRTNEKKSGTQVGWWNKRPHFPEFVERSNLMFDLRSIKKSIEDKVRIWEESGKWLTWKNAKHWPDNQTTTTTTECECIRNEWQNNIRCR